MNSRGIYQPDKARMVATRETSIGKNVQYLWRVLDVGRRTILRLKRPTNRDERLPEWENPLEFAISYRPNHTLHFGEIGWQTAKLYYIESWCQNYKKASLQRHDSLSVRSVTSYRRRCRACKLYWSSIQPPWKYHNTVHLIRFRIDSRGVKRHFPAVFCYNFATI
jgi:hypothetical protein